MQVTLGEKPGSQGVAYLGVTYGRGMALPGGMPAPFRFPGGLPGGVSGLVVSEAVAGGPAANAGLKAGDVITAVDGKAVTDLQALRTILDGRKPGDVLRLTVRRDGADQQISLTLGEDPQNAGKAYAGLRLGVVIEKRQENVQPQTNPGGLRQGLENRLRQLPQKLQEIIPRALRLPVSRVRQVI